MTIYKYILRDGKLKVTEMEAVSLPDGYSVKRGPVRFFIERDEIGKAVGNNLKHVYLLKRDDALAASAFMRYKQRNLEELKEIAERLKEDIRILKEIVGECDYGANGRMPGMPREL